MIAEAKAAIDAAKLITGIAKSANNLEWQQRAVDLQLQILELVERLEEARAEASRLRDALKLRDELRFEDGVYWRGPDRSEASGPYCSRCADVTGRAVRMLFDLPDLPRCPECKTQVEFGAREGQNPRPGNSESWSDESWPGDPPLRQGF